MPDLLVDVDGTRLDVRVAGAGAPAVVCMSALGGAHDYWRDVARMLSEETTVVTYARPGLGDSDRLPAAETALPRDGGWLAAQLRSLLRRAGIVAPYVLTSGSIGGFIIDQFAARWPDEVAGLVLNDPTGPRPFVGLADPDRPYATNDGDLADADEGGVTFSGDLLRTFLSVPAPANRDGRYVVLSSAVGRWLRSEPADWHRPLTLAEVDAQWVEMQVEWTRRLSALHVVADTAGHHIYRDAPALTAFVVREVVDAARRRRPVRIDRDALAAVAGHLAGPDPGRRRTS
ncbi:alpha/beta fold hydrolase [Pseudonocardia sp. HH130630-07]|uniref:alpha/beta fold hydrolase n=1 Tax=Pseudonocardia sp. HH130630-07 TaxID=1690815 RepID=UPI0008150593|nr:alpha/beta fold hydrolase [Pseudonocardia sp. HH130630-07]ANY05370.1 hypothetical protein AFB00_02510 [Pseudonocardia sp. HH130630-07]